MHDPSETCWSLIHGAADGQAAKRDEFARRYLPTVRAYLAARWKSSPLHADIDDVAQEVFVACFRQGGALHGVDSQHPSGFRAFLYGVTRNAALHAERSQARRAKRVVEGDVEADRVPSDEASVTRAFDRSYAIAVVDEARRRMLERARDSETATRRVELLKLRFQNGMPIREIAALWSEDAAHLHGEYRKAGREFKVAFADVVAESERCAPEKLSAACEELLDLLR